MLNTFSFIQYSRNFLNENTTEKRVDILSITQQPVYYQNKRVFKFGMCRTYILWICCFESVKTSIGFYHPIHLNRVTM